jgi:LEA14-like dessication related protein
MKARKWGVVIIVLLVVIAVGVSWWMHSGKKALQSSVRNAAPKVTLASMNIKDIDPEDIKMECGITVSNPLPVGFKADSLHYELWIDSVMVMRDTYKKSISLSRNDSTSIKLPLDIKSAALKRLVDKFDRHHTDSADYTIQTNFKMNVPVAGKRAFNLNVTKRLPAIRKITAKPGKVDLNKLGLKDSELGITVKVTNDNSFPIDISNGKYTITVDKDLDLQGTMQKNVHIPANGAQDVSMNIKLKTAKVPKLGWKILFHKKQTHYNMHFTGQLKSDIKMLDNTALKMNAEGTLEDLKELAQTK